MRFNKAPSRAKGLIILTLLFMIVGTGALFFVLNPLDQKVANTKRDYKQMELVKTAILRRVKFSKGTLTSTIIFSGINDYPGTMPCPENTASNVLGKKGEGGEKLTCHDSTKSENYLGRLAWRSLGIVDYKDSKDAPIWYLVNLQYTKDKKDEQDHKKLNSDFNNNDFGENHPMYWSDDGVSIGEEVVAIIFAPQKTRTGQTRKITYSSTDKPNHEDYIEIVREVLINPNELIIRRRTQACIDSGKCPSGDISNDFVVTISKSEWLAASQQRVASTFLYCINKFRKDSVRFPVSSPSHLPMLEQQPLGSNIADNKFFGQFSLSSSPSKFDAFDIEDSLPSNFDGVPDANKVIATGYDWQDICNNIFNRYINLIVPSAATPPLTTPSITAVNIVAGALCPNGCERNLEFNSVYIPDGTWDSRDAKLLFDEGEKKDRWGAQWLYSMFYAYAPAACQINRTRIDCLQVETTRGCRLSDAVILFPNEALPPVTARPMPPLYQRGTTPVNFPLEYSLYNDATLSQPELFFEDENRAAKTTFIFRKKTASSSFNDAVYFNDIGACP